MYAVWWCQYSIGGQFLVVANAESDNDWVQTSREIYEACHRKWLKRVNAGNCWNGLPPPGGIEIPAPTWDLLTWDEVVCLGFPEMIDSTHPEYLALVYGGLPPAVKG
jgi:hypothetical protein